jgi:putative restriction endonuclease
MPAGDAARSRLEVTAPRGALKVPCWLCRRVARRCGQTGTADQVAVTAGPIWSCGCRIISRLRVGLRFIYSLIACVAAGGISNIVPNAVFTAKLDSSYDDAVEERYHFPKQYLGRVSQAVGDWIVYYEPRRGGGRMVYFAIARIARVEPDVAKADHYYAHMVDYSVFAEPVSFRAEGELLESSLRNPDGSTNNGAAINAVRPLSSGDFQKICALGMKSVIEDVGADALPLAGDLAVAETQAEYGGPRRMISVSRPLRDAAFARVVKTAYDRTCSMTGLKLINGGGRSEIEAAHIKPVENEGPDSPRNGIALSRTVHWLFDRGFLSIGDDGQILQAKKLVPEPVKRLLNPDGRIILPRSSILSPHRVFLRWHREVKFKG